MLKRTKSKVIKRYKKDELVKFEKLNKNGGVVKPYEAIKRRKSYQNKNPIINSGFSLFLVLVYAVYEVSVYLYFSLLRHV